MLIFQIKRIIPSEKWFNYVVAFFFFFFFFFENAKNLGRSETLNGEKKRGCLIINLEKGFCKMLSFWEPAIESQTNWYWALLFIPVHIIQKLSPSWLDVILKKMNDK